MPRRPSRPSLEPLEDRLALTGLTNGTFDVSNPADPGFGWTTAGSASVDNNEGLLAESVAVNAQFSQGFTLPANTSLLRFTLVANGLQINGDSQPIDAFEVALLDTASNPLVGPATDLPNTDAFLNIQQTGQVWFNETLVSVPGATNSGDVVSLTYPVVVTVNVSGLAGGTQGTIFFDLLGFGSTASTFRIDNVDFLQGPPLTLQLAAASDSGTLGDDLTNITPVTLTGTTDANQTVLLDLDGDGFDDGSVAADGDGLFSFPNVALLEGANTFRVSSTNVIGTTITPRTFTLDTQSPVGALAQPLPDSTVNGDPGFVDIQWSDFGAAGLDATTFDLDDVTLAGVDIDSFENLGNGRVRYVYNADGDTLPPGSVTVNQVAGAIADLAGNASVARSQSFTINSVPVANNDSAATTAPASVTITVLTNDTDADGTLAPATVTVVTQPAQDAGTAVANADGTITYTPGTATGDVTFTYTVQDNLGATSNAATVTVTVNASPVAVNDSAMTTAPTAVTITVLTNDSDADGTLAPGSVMVVAQPATGGGTAVANADGTITYTPGTTTGDVTFTYTVQDNLGATSNAATVTVTVTASPGNAPPVITTTPDNLVFTENDAARAVDPGLLVSDADSANLVGATVRITGNYVSGQDVLAFTSQAGITGTFDAATGTLTLTGTASVAAYQAALRSVTYANASDLPSGSLRTVTFTVNDGAAQNNTASATRSIDVRPVNDRPTITAPASLQTFRNAPLVLNTTRLISFADVDANGQAVKVTLQVTRGRLRLASVTGLTFDSGFGNNRPEIRMTGTLAAINAALVNLRYTPTANTAGARSLVVTVNDQGNSGGAAETATQTIPLNVVARRPVVVAPPVFLTQRRRQLVIPAGLGLLARASSPDRAPMSVRLFGAAPPGLVLRADGSFSFLAPSLASNVVTFQVRVFDGLLFSDPITVRIRISDNGRGRGF